MRWISLIFIIGLTFGFVTGEEGMYPLTELQRLNLKKIGFELEARDIFAENAVSLSDAIVNLSGCTGSLISPQGLILTNHHCAYSAAQQASDSIHDFIRDGYLARTPLEELPAKGFTVRITESYRDVSDEVLSDLSTITDPAERHKAIEKRIKGIVAKVEADQPGIRAEVAEMFSGKTYTLFIYDYLKDVRLVYIPPRAIGEFGGDEDNWEWPRHNADFALLRAYYGPDGKTADYSAENIPYQPKRFLKVAAGGVKEGDLVFMLGYPGRTFRHQPSPYLLYEQEVRMPMVVEWNNWQMDRFEKQAQLNPEKALALHSRIKGLANTEKNYRGKLQGIKRLNLLAGKQAEEASISIMIDADKKLKEKYGNVLNEIRDIYENDRVRATRDYLLGWFTGSVNLTGVANSLYRAAEERQKPDLERESPYMDRNFAQTKKRALLNLVNIHPPTDQVVLAELLSRINNLPAERRITQIDSIFGLTGNTANLNEYIHKTLETSRLTDAAYVDAAYQMTPQQLKALNDPIIAWVEALQPLIKAQKQKSEARSGKLEQLLAKWLEMKQLYLKTEFIPDANSTFRFTWGHIRGYSPADAVYKAPFTTLSGVAEKTTGVIPFDAPQKLLDLQRSRNYGRFLAPGLGDLPVDMLYDMDTTGGNSGSPVLNARGELIGLNFDRAFEATINDYNWSPKYSRSIGVDIRYILWLLDQFAGADYLLQEMGVTAR
jgi:hypothetical protein